MPSKKASLINFRQPVRQSEAGEGTRRSLDDFVNSDPEIPTPSLPAPLEPIQAPPVAESPPTILVDARINVTFNMKKKLHKALKRRAATVEKKLQYLMEDALESYMDKHDPQWRNDV